MTPVDIVADCLALPNHGTPMERAKDIALALANGGYYIVHDPRADAATEPPADVYARAQVSLDAALARANVSGADAAVLRRACMPAWAAWAASMQAERLVATDRYRVRAAALLVMVNVFWETVVHTTPGHLWGSQGSRFLGQLEAAIKEGPGER